MRTIRLERCNSALLRLRRRLVRRRLGACKTRRRTGCALALTATLGLVCPVSPARSEPSQRDLQTLARAMGFLEPQLSGTIEIGIVYPQAQASGRLEAERVATEFGGGLRAGSLMLRPKLVPVEAVMQAGTPVLLLTDAAAPDAASVARAIAGRSVLTVSSDRALVDAGLAVMAIRSEPRVEICVSRAAAQNAGVGFTAAFRMMIQER